MKTYLEINEIEQPENAATCLRDKFFIRLLARLDCRISEALALGVKNIDSTRGMVTIEHLKSRVELTCPQCGAKLGKTHAFCAK
jgi:integrase/recombinase XerD